MLGKITKATVDKLPLGSLLWDVSLVGFGVRRQLRHPHYVVRYRFGGKQKLLSIGRHGAWTPETARREAQRLLGVVASGVDPGLKAEEGDSFVALVERYLSRKQATLRPRSFVETVRHLRKQSASLHQLALSEITRRDLAEVLAKVEVESGAIARNRLRTSLSSFWRWAITEGLIENNPVQGTARVGEGSRERVLTADELRRVWLACGNDDFGRIVRLLMLTGQRRNEIAKLQWNEIDLTGAALTLSAQRTKNGRQHTLPLSQQALALLNAIPRREGAVFHNVNWFVVKSRLDAQAKIAPWTLHDLRRSCATGMAELGVQPHIIESVLNHVSGHKAGVAGIYNRARYEGEMRSALQRWADHVDRITA
jgi:integrase